jgi:hypothetical protein
MKKIILLLLVAIFTLVPLSVSAQSEIKVVLEGTEIIFDQPPVIISDRTMVPVRAIYEALGADVSWDGATRTASGEKNGIIVSFTIDEPQVSINYNKKEIDAPAVIVNDRTLVPVRALAEGFGVKVDWDADTRTVILVNNDTTATITDFVAAGDRYSTYTGQVVDGVPDGYGTGTLATRVDTYFIGLWEDGIPAVGRVYTNDTTFGFTGFAGYSYGDINGYSEITIASGETYRGNWENNMMNGYGELYMADGSYYKGEFKDNTMHGYGEAYDAATGMTAEGNWENGEFIG